jgi:hypothetical protein
VIIDGNTQPGTTPGTPQVQLDGSTQSNTSTGLDVEGGLDGSVIRGLSVTGFKNAGIALEGPPSVVEGSYIGLAPSGAVAGNGSGVDSLDGGIIVDTDGTSRAHRRDAERHLRKRRQRSAATASRASSGQLSTTTDGTDNGSGRIHEATANSTRHRHGQPHSGTPGLHPLQQRLQQRRGGSGNTIGLTATIGAAHGAARGRDQTQTTHIGARPPGRDVISGNGGAGIDMQSSSGSAFRAI